MFNELDLKICVGLIAVGAAVFLASLGLPEVTLWGAPDPDRPYQAGAGTWPRIVSVVMIVLCTLYIINRSLEEKNRKPEQAAGPDEKPLKNKMALSFMGVFTAYMLLLNPLGFPIATLLFGAGTVLALDTGSLGKIKSLALSSLIAAGIVAVFSKLLYLPLPRGLGVFREISQWLIF